MALVCGASNDFILSSDLVLDLTALNLGWVNVHDPRDRARVAISFYFRLYLMGNLSPLLAVWMLLDRK